VCGGGDGFVCGVGSVGTVRSSWGTGVEVGVCGCGGEMEYRETLSFAGFIL
jgi:hypothetical protein